MSAVAVMDGAVDIVVALILGAVIAIVAARFFAVRASLTMTLFPVLCPVAAIALTYSLSAPISAVAYRLYP